MIGSKDAVELAKFLGRRLFGKDINWAIYSGMNLILHGINVKAKDVDILTDKDGIYKMADSLKTYLTRDVDIMDTEKFRAHSAKFTINGFEVEVLADLKNKIPKGDLWTETKGLTAKTFLQFEDVKVPVISLKQEYKAHSALGKFEKVIKIKEALDNGAE
jgi:hypothetical protein